MIYIYFLFEVNKFFFNVIECFKSGEIKIFFIENSKLIK